MTMTPPGSTAFDPVSHVEKTWENAQAQHGKLSESAGRLGAVRRELDELMKMGPNVTPEDVIKGAGALVGAGMSPQSLAQLLSSMPTNGGEALAAWVEQQDQQVRGMEQQSQAQVKASAIHRGIAAMTKLNMDHVRGKVQARSQAAAAPMAQAPVPNALQGGENA